jgi:hypothetical protein
MNNGGRRSNSSTAEEVVLKARDSNKTMLKLLKTLKDVEEEYV